MLSYRLLQENRNSEDAYILDGQSVRQAIAMSEELQATLERIAEQQEENTTAISPLIERQTQNEANIARLLHLVPQVIQNAEPLNDLSRVYRPAL